VRAPMLLVGMWTGTAILENNMSLSSHIK
jgi:hypothetical protein